MSPTVPGGGGAGEPSPLTNRKLLAALKGVKPHRISIDTATSLGTRYKKKSTSIRFTNFLQLGMCFKVEFKKSRRFTSSVEKLRSDQRQIKCSRNPDSLATFEQRDFSWPAKELQGGDLSGVHARDDLDIVRQQGVDRGGQQGGDRQARPAVTSCGRNTVKRILLSVRGTFHKCV